ncbi:methyltransferase domain-containing protein [Phormidesmis priestleyi ULC007]|uniref:Methyltransferase domain-containing protein n=1 Tax=Phormidesmis priestleyi ULC007 TaxID=1920490 RepID=A0A2T1DIM7_9CYAN|nr:glycosyltransferase [Phormidesmis priestleyi]PSB20360.1 methyltransferase domain-containing protein [Phormidesmis priestleyi ULC007]PZO52937.1 MAG: methyltransferase domain-containing protein [Phormidesmis priestleyi]
MITSLKILVITNLYPPQVLGGYERSIADFARLLQHRGHTVLVLTSDTPQFSVSHPSLYPDPPIERCLLLMGEWSSQGFRWFDHQRVVDVRQQNQAILKHHLEHFQPDVCLAGNLDFVQTQAESLALLLSHQVPVAHYVMNARSGYDPEHTPRSSLYHFITCSNLVTASLEASGYPAAATAQTLHPGADVDAFYQVELPPRDRLRIAYTNLVTEDQGADVLVEALSLLHAAGIEFTATIAGGTFQPEFVDALKQFIESEGLQEAVHFPGALSRQELIQLYKTHNVLVFPSRFEEPFGISQIEAMAAGLTLVTSGTGGAREIVEEHGKDGLIFESENPFDLADILSSLPTDLARWDAIARTGQQRAMSKFNQTKAVKKLEAIFLELIALKDTQPKSAIKLHLGGKEPHSDWKILDIEPRPEVDFIGDAADLSQFADGSIDTIYASHILEHFHYSLNNELITTLAEWYRVLQPGGQLMVSVPNLQTLCWLYLNPNLRPMDRHQLMRIIFGGHMNQYDVHRVGFDPDTLALYLQEVGFVDCTPVSEFGLFNDCSSMKILDNLISVNMIATKPE